MGGLVLSLFVVVWRTRSPEVAPRLVMLPGPLWRPPPLPLPPPPSPQIPHPPQILFQCHARYAPLTADAIAAAADASEGYAASDDGEGDMAFVTTTDGWVEALG